MSCGTGRVSQLGCYAAAQCSVTGGLQSNCSQAHRERPMSSGSFLRALALVVVPLTRPVALPAQPPDATFMGVSVGVAARPTYYRNQPFGLEAGFTLRRALSRRVIWRLDAEVQRFGVRDTSSHLCSPGGCEPPAPNGPVATVALLASGEWYARPDRGSFYLLGGFGPQWLASNPDGPRALHLLLQAGLGFALGPKGLSMEIRYQWVARAPGDATQSIPISVTFRAP